MQPARERARAVAPRQQPLHREARGLGAFIHIYLKGKKSIYKKEELGGPNYPEQWWALGDRAPSRQEQATGSHHHPHTHKSQNFHKELAGYI